MFIFRISSFPSYFLLYSQWGQGGLRAYSVAETQVWLKRPIIPRDQRLFPFWTKGMSQWVWLNSTILADIEILITTIAQEALNISAFIDLD